MTLQELHDRIRATKPDALVEERKGHPGGPYLVVKPSHLRDVVQWLRDDPALKFQVLQCLSGVDHGVMLSSVYHLDSYALGLTVVLKVELQDRTHAEVPSIADLHHGADWHERESFDLLGITYVGHPNLVRILCAEDWEGHPLRKDYVFPKEYHGIPNDI